LLLSGCLLVMRPFVTALLWAVVQIAGKTVRGVVYGVLGTALGGGVSARLSRHCDSARNINSYLASARVIWKRP